MQFTRTLAGLWRRYRALAVWVQLTVAVGAALVAVSSFTSSADQSVSAGAPATTTTEVPTTVAGTPTQAVTTTRPAPAPTTTTGSSTPAGDDSSVLRVIDGDTFVVAGGTHVRLIGVDTPETGDCFSVESTRYMNELLPVGTAVRLVYDVERLDRYGRTLAYVYKRTDGVFVNLAVARNGFASQLTVPPNVAHAEEFRSAVAQARGGGLGLWRGCQAPAPASATTSAPTTQVTVARATTTSAAGGGCHPSYAGACVPTGFSDVDCAGGTGNGPGYVSAKNFQVVGPDVYGLDTDGDGIACESK